MTDAMDLDRRLRAWGAMPTGETWTTPSSRLAAGVRDGVPVVLKVATVEEERRGGRLLAWWGRHGGLPVLEADDDAVLMVRATGPMDLAAWSAAGRDEEADEVLAATVLALHALPVPPPTVGLVPLATWFRDLVDRPQDDPLLVRAAGIARDLLAADGPVVVLHGDVHHGNVLDLGGRWAAIDPKALVGHPAFDVANVLCNPTEAAAARRVEARVALFADLLALDPDEVAAWTVAWCGLSLAWQRGEASWHDRAARDVATRLVLTSRW